MDKVQAELLRIDSPDRVQLFFEYIQVVIDIMGVKKGGQQGKTRALGIKLQRIGLQLMVVASDEVVEKFIKWRAIAMAGEFAEEVVEAFADVVFAMRKDIVGETVRKPDDIMDILF